MQNGTKKQTLCILVDMFIVGGMERVILDALKNLSQYYAVTLFVLSDCVDTKFRIIAEKYATVRIEGVRITPLYHVLLRLPYIGGRMYRRYIHEQYDILIVARDLCMSAAFGGISEKNIYWCHSDKDMMYADDSVLPFLRRINKTRLKRLYRKCDQVWVLNDEIKCAIDEAFKPKRTEIVPNPIDCENIIAKSNEKLTDFCYNDARLNIALVGRLSEEKGFIRVIRALNEKKLFEKVCLHIVGDGPEREKIEAEIGEKSKQVVCKFYGVKENPYPYIGQADLLICPSYTESFGIVMLEAMLLKIPVLATNTVGARFVTSNGRYGIMVENCDDALGTAIERFINKTCQPDEMVTAAFNHAKEFNINVFNELILKLLNV